MTQPPAHIRLRVWDLPTRVFHWALALCFVGLVVSGSLGGEFMVLHLRLGHTMLALLLFRLVWGVVGGRWSRWSHFHFSPSALADYVRGRWSGARTAGHSPLGSWAALAMLGLLLVQVAAGLISDDEIAFAGPLASRVPNAWVSLATSYHTFWGKWALLALVSLHLAALVFYTRRKQRLVAAMLHGDKVLTQADTPAEQPQPARDDTASRLLALLLLGLCALAAYAVANLAAPTF